MKTKRGVSAFIRIRDEELYIESSLRSLAGIFEEYIIVFNNCKDNTEEIVLKTISELQIQAKLFYYNFDLKNVDTKDERSHASFYNYALSKVATRRMYKWDGDCIALPCLKDNINRYKKIQSGMIADKGINVIKQDGHYFVSKIRYCGPEPRFVSMTPDVHFVQDRNRGYEVIRPHENVVYTEDINFLHMHSELDLHQYHHNPEGLKERYITDIPLEYEFVNILQRRKDGITNASDSRNM